MLGYYALVVCNRSCNVYAACRRMGKGMGDTAAVADDIQAVVAALEVIIYLYFHIIEFNLYAVKKSILVCRTGGNFIEGLDHFDNAVQNTLGEHKAKIARGCV